MGATPTPGASAPEPPKTVAQAVAAAQHRLNAGGPPPFALGSAEPALPSERPSEAKDDAGRPPAGKEEPAPQPEKATSETQSAGQKSSDYEAWLAKYGGPNKDPEVAAREALDDNNRLAALSKGKPTETATEPEKGGAPAETEEPATVAAEPDEAAILEAADTYAREDEDCRSLRAQFAEIIKFKDGQLVGGSLFDTLKDLKRVDRRITGLEVALDEKEGIDLDPVQREEKQQELQRLRDRKELLSTRKDTLEAKAERYRERFDARVARFQEDFKAKARTKAQTDADVRENTKAEQAALSEWATSLDSTVKEFDEDDRAEVREELFLRARAFYDDPKHPEHEDVPFADFTKKAAAEIRAKLDRHKGKADKTLALDKARLNRQPAPRGGAADADVPANPTSPRERLRDVKTRTRQAAREWDRSFGRRG